LTERQSLGEETFWLQMKGALTAVPVKERHAVVFIHGFNVSFDAAALRAAQIGADLNVRGAMGFFSWPSRDTLKGYLADAASIEASEDHIAEFLVGFAQVAGPDTPVSVIAHSMGNRGILRAVNRIVSNAQRSSELRFNQFILAAADVDDEVFRKLCVPYATLGERTTLYVSAHDNAVGASGYAHGAPRIGRIPPVPIIDMIDTIDVGAVDLSLLGHGYVAQTRAVLGDMHALIWKDADPNTRFGLTKTSDATGKPYWKMKA
jgi:esterase/lipase superfamily enzyme